MSHDLDRALDDIIGGSGSDSGRHSGRSRKRVEHRRSSPYIRNQQQNDAPDRQSTRSPSGVRGKWSHDMFERSSNINDRLGSTSKGHASERMPSVKSINSRIGHGAKVHVDTAPARGISIAGRSRNTTPYDEFRVVWVSGMPGSLTQEKIESVFGDVGRIDAVRMAIDSSGRFVGKAEIVYRLAEDARSAIQVFDGELLYGTDDVRVEKMSITYSSAANADYIDSLKYTQPLRNDQRHRGQGAYSSQRSDRNQHQQSSNNNRRNDRRHQSNNDNRPAPTTEQLDADLDAYMGGSEETDTKPDLSSREMPVAGV
ncbi:hypothetical protein GGI20_000215 [Coemansia sp. BCRC 34301]|nr:hypothetical protein GGI20_000215 [Coemansia sp. BCRC 34301]